MILLESSDHQKFDKRRLGLSEVLSRTPYIVPPSTFHHPSPPSFPWRSRLDSARRKRIKHSICNSFVGKFPFQDDDVYFQFFGDTDGKENDCDSPSHQVVFPCVSPNRAQCSTLPRLWRVGSRGNGDPVKQSVWRKLSLGAESPCTEKVKKFLSKLDRSRDTSRTENRVDDLQAPGRWCLIDVLEVLQGSVFQKLDVKRWTNTEGKPETLGTTLTML